MTMFKKGDVVRRIKDFDYLARGEYVVEWVSSSQNAIKLVGKGTTEFTAKYFELVIKSSESQARKHADIIKAWADGAEVEFFNVNTGSWQLMKNSPSWCVSTQYRVYVKPERVFPKSSIGNTELTRIYNNSANTAEGFRAIADAAVKQYILDSEEPAQVPF